MINYNFLDATVGLTGVTTGCVRNCKDVMAGDKLYCHRDFNGTLCFCTTPSKFFVGYAGANISGTMNSINVYVISDVPVYDNQGGIMWFEIGQIYDRL